MSRKGLEAYRRGRWPVCWLVNAFLPFALAAAASAQMPGAEQGIHGRLLDAETNQAIEGAVVTLLDGRENEVRSTTTGPRGAFSLAIRVPGRYVLQASRIGYLESASPPLDVREGEWVDIELHASTQAIPLAPLVVMSDRPALVLDGRLERWGYYERKMIYGRLGAHFLDYEELQRRSLLSVSGVLRTLTGVRVHQVGRRSIEITNRRGVPMILCVDNLRVGRLRGDEIPIDELVAFSEVVAIEVYPSGLGASAAPGPVCHIRVWTGIPPGLPR